MKQGERAVSRISDNANQVRTGLTLMILGFIREKQERLSESFELHKQALEYYQSRLGSMHPHTAKALVIMSDHYVRCGMLDQGL